MYSLQVSVWKFMQAVCYMLADLFHKSSGLIHCCHLQYSRKLSIIIYPLTAKIVRAPQMISQPVSSIFLCSLLPSGIWQTPGLSIPWWCCFPTSSSVCLVFSPPFTVPCKMVFARPDERETWPYHCSLRLFTMVRSSCGPIACWILAQTSSLVTWSLYEMRSILR